MLDDRAGVDASQAELSHSPIVKRPTHQFLDPAHGWMRWCENWPLQCVLVAFAVYQTKLINMALESSKQDITSSLLGIRSVAQVPNICCLGPMLS